MLGLQRIKRRLCKPGDGTLSSPIISFSHIILPRKVSACLPSSPTSLLPNCPRHLKFVGRSFQLNVLELKKLDFRVVLRALLGDFYFKRRKKKKNRVPKCLFWKLEHLGSQRGGHFTSQRQCQSRFPAENPFLLYSSAQRGMAVNSRALCSPPGAHASKRMCQKETLNRLQYPLVLDTGNHNFGIFLVRKYSQTQGQNKTWLKIMKLKLIHPTLALVSNLLFSSLFWYFAVYTIIRLEIYHTSWAGIHNKCARIKYRWRFNYHAAHAF